MTVRRTRAVGAALALMGVVATSGHASAAPAAVECCDGHKQVYVLLADGRYEGLSRCDDNALWVRWQDSSGAWTDWSSRGGTLITEVDAMTAGDGMTGVFGIGQDNALWVRWHFTPEGTWSDWGDLGGALTSKPVASARDDGLIVVYARGTDQRLWSIEQADDSQGGWGDWRVVG